MPPSLMIGDKNICPVCGYDGLDEELWPEGISSFEICPACGVEYGYDDAAKTHAERVVRWSSLREKWISNGLLWFSSATNPPSGWDGGLQLKNLHEIGIEIDPSTLELLSKKQEN